MPSIILAANYINYTNAFYTDPGELVEQTKGLGHLQLVLGSAEIEVQAPSLFWLAASQISNRAQHTQGV